MLKSPCLLQALVKTLFQVKEVPLSLVTILSFFWFLFLRKHVWMLSDALSTSVETSHFLFPFIMTCFIEFVPLFLGES